MSLIIDVVLRYELRHQKQVEVCEANSSTRYHFLVMSKYNKYDHGVKQMQKEKRRKGHTLTGCPRMQNSKNQVLILKDL